MLRKKANLVLLALAVPAVVLTGCGKKAFIKVQGEEVSKDEFYSRLERVPVQTPQGTKMAGQYVVEQLVGEKLIVQLAKKENVEPTDAQIESKIKVINRESGNNLAGLLRNQGMTTEDLKKKIKSEQALINLVSKGIRIPDAKVKSAYDQELARANSAFKRPDQVRISAVICKTKDRADQAHKALVGGAEFASVAMQYSDDPNIKNTKGVIPNWFDKANNIVPKPIKNAAFSLDVNKYSDPMQVGNTWVIVKTDQKRKAKVTKFEDVKDLIKEQLAMQEGAKNSTFSEDLRKYTTEASIEVNNDRYKDIPAQIKEQVKKQATSLELPKPGSSTPTTP